MKVIDDMVSKEEILKRLEQVEDPELGINIVDLGLVYDVKIEGKKVFIKITFTTPACPLMNHMLNDVKAKLEDMEDLDIEVDVVFDPPWSPEKMSKKAKMKLGIL